MGWRKVVNVSAIRIQVHSTKYLVPSIIFLCIQHSVISASSPQPLWAESAIVYRFREYLEIFWHVFWFVLCDMQTKIQSEIQISMENHKVKF